MADEGTLVTAAATLVASASFLLAAHAARPREEGDRRGAVRAFYAIVGAFLALSGTRQLFAYAGAVEVDRALFLALVLPAGLTIVPLVHLTSTILWDKPRRTLVLDGVFAALVLVGLAAFYAEGISGPDASYWGTEWSIDSLLAQAILVLAVTLPALACGATIATVASKLDGPDRKRLRAVGWSIIVYYVVFTTDAFALSGAVLVVERLVTAGTALWTWGAYRESGG